MPEKIGNEFQLNTNTYASFISNTEKATSAISLSNGNIVSIWQSNGQAGSNYGVYGQIFDTSGNKSGTEFQINTYTTDSQFDPSVSGLSNGNFIVVWTSNGQDGDAGSIHGQIFNSGGSKHGTEFQANTYTVLNQRKPSVSALNNGGFVVTWESDSQDGSGYGVYGQVFNSGGSMVGSEFQVNSYTSSTQGIPSVIGLNNGGFVIVWQSVTQDGSNYGIFSQIFDLVGTKVGLEVQVNTNTSGRQSSPSVSVLSNGNFVVVWESGSFSAGFGQIFGENGGKVGTEFKIISNSVGGLSVSALSNANFVVVWTESLSIVYGQVFDHYGIKVDSGFLINSNSGYNCKGNFISALNNRRFLVVWERTKQNSLYSCDVYGQIFKNPLSVENSNQVADYLLNTQYSLNLDIVDIIR